MSVSTRFGALAAPVVLSFCLGACASPLDTALGLAGVKRSAPAPHVVPASTADRAAPGRAPRSAPVAATSGYEYGPAFEWSRYAMSRPFIPGFELGHDVHGASCVAVPQGLSRVLPAPEGTAANDVLRVGPVAAGVAGVPVTRVDEFMGWQGGSLTTVMLERGRTLASREACATSVFAYVRIGLGANDDPVSVLR